MKAQKAVTSHASGRDRLLATARDLFLRRGASNVGINDVTDFAGVAKMTLYNNFKSKEALVFAVYEELIEATLIDLRRTKRARQSEEKLILAVFEYFDSKARADGYRGCPLIHASLQDAEPSGAIYALVQSYKRLLREYVYSLLKEDRVNRSELADQILILLDGAVTEKYLKGAEDPFRSAKGAATTLIRLT